MRDQRDRDEICAAHKLDEDKRRSFHSSRDMPTHRVVKIDELSQYFHLPEKAVAKQLGVCLTSLKKICRQNNITRWPYRKLKSLDKKINKIESALTSSAEDPAAMLVKWEMLKQEKKNLPFSNSSDDSDQETKKQSTPSPLPALTEITLPTRSVAQPSPVPMVSVSPILCAAKLTDWNVNTPTSPETAASEASTPIPAVPVRAMHTMLQRKLRQVGSLSSHREQLARSQGTTPTPAPEMSPALLTRPAELVLEDEQVEPAMSLADFYHDAPDSGRFNSSHEMALDESFRMPTIQPESFSFSDLFPGMQDWSHGDGVDSLDLLS